MKVKELKDDVIISRIPGKLKQIIKRIAMKEKSSISAYIQKLIRTDIEKRNINL